MSTSLNYIIIGDGKLAKHVCCYFNLLNISFAQWSRRKDSVMHLADICQSANRILLMISDSEIENFIKDNICLPNKIIIHFSGSLVTELAQSAHPLMTFTNDVYDLATYQSIPFITEQEGMSFSEMFPDLNNPHYAIPRKLKSFYHALCVMSGNFTTLLWQKFFSELENTFNIPKDAAFPYLNRIVKNLQTDAKEALTGPIARRDKTTIQTNVDALKNDPFLKIYLSFVEVFND